MWFWIVAAIMTLASCMALLVPLLGKPRKALADHAHDIEVYRDQLQEVDRDTSRGLISAPEAVEARAEIGRRIIRVGSAPERPDRRDEPSLSGKWLVTAAILAVPLLSWGLYAELGSPDLPSEPLAARLVKNPANSSIDELVARAEAHLAKVPSDARGWQVLAPVYVRMNRYHDAIDAYRNAIRLSGPSAELESGLGEAIVAQASGVVSADAEAAFDESLKLQPGNPKARFFKATGLAQEGKSALAITAWHGMLVDLPANSPWRAPVEQAMASFGIQEADAAPTPSRRQDEGAGPLPGPTAQQMQAAAGMSSDDRKRMIEAMVVRLDTQLRQKPDDPQGWQRLVRSYMVLGKHDQASAALSRALSALGADSPAGKELVALADSLGVPRQRSGS